MAWEKKRRAGLAFARLKQIWIWSAALIFSYADIISTVAVGFQYLAIGDKGRDAAHMTFGMLFGSIAIQTFFTYFGGGSETRACRMKYTA